MPKVFVHGNPENSTLWTVLFDELADAVYKNLGLLDLHKPEAVLVLSGDHVYHAIGNRRWQTTRPVAIIVVQAVCVVVESVWVDRGVFRWPSLETG